MARLVNLPYIASCMPKLVDSTIKTFVAEEPKIEKK